MAYDLETEDEATRAARLRAAAGGADPSGNLPDAAAIYRRHDEYDPDGWVGQLARAVDAPGPTEIREARDDYRGTPTAIRDRRDDLRALNTGPTPTEIRTLKAEYRPLPSDIRASRDAYLLENPPDTGLTPSQIRARRDARLTPTGTGGVEVQDAASGITDEAATPVLMGGITPDSPRSPWLAQPRHDLSQADTTGRPIDMTPPPVARRRPASNRVVAPLPPSQEDVDARKVAGLEDIDAEEPDAPLPPDPINRRPAGTTASMEDLLASYDPFVDREASMVGRTPREPAPTREPVAPSPDPAGVDRANANDLGWSAALDRFREDVVGALANRKPDYSGADRIDAQSARLRANADATDATAKAAANDAKVSAALASGSLAGLNSTQLATVLAIRAKRAEIAKNERVPKERDYLGEIRARAAAEGEQDRLTQDAKPLPVVLPPAPKEADPLLEDRRALIKAQTDRARRPPAQKTTGGSAPPVVPETIDDMARGVGMTPEALRQAADNYNRTGSLGSYGSGGAGIKLAIQNAAGILRQQSTSPVDPTSNAPVFKADAGAVTNLSKRAASIGATIGAAMKEAQFVLDNSAKVPRMTSAPWIEDWIVSGRAELAGDPAAQKFIGSVETLANSYSRILSMSPTGAGQSTDSQKEHVRRIIHPGLTQEQIRQSVAQILAEMDAAELATQEALTTARARLAPGGAQPQVAATDKPPAGAAIGARWTNPNGTVYEKAAGGWKKVTGG